jgi:hypothetical protein
MTELIPSEKNLVSKLTRDIKYRLAEDRNIAYESREAFIAQQDDVQLIEGLLNTMQKGDRARATLDFLLHLENSENTNKIIRENARLTQATVILAYATVILCVATIWIAYNTH